MILGRLYHEERGYRPVAVIESHLRARGFSPSVVARVARLNRNGVPEGAHPRGLHLAPTIRYACLCMDVVSLRHYDARWGNGAHRALPRCAWVKISGKRRAILRRVYFKGGM